MSRGRQIGRLKLRPLEPEVAARFLMDWDAADLRQDPSDFPHLTSAELFANNLPLQVEIGCGSGEYLCHLAAGKPEGNFLGIEVSRRPAFAAAALAAEQGLGNLLILRCDFRLLYPLYPEAGWAAVYLHFPDPFERRQDVKRQLFGPDFLDKMADVLAPGGKISVVSDKPDFFLRMLGVAERHRGFEKVHSERFLEGFEAGVKSRFQRSWEGKGIAPLRFILRKVEL